MVKMDKEKSYKQFAKLMKKHKVKAAQVARGANIPPSTFSDWKAGVYMPKFDKIKRIADYFGVSVDYFLK